MYSYGPLHMDEQRIDDHLESIYSSYVPIQAVALSNYPERWTIETSCREGPGKSLLAARNDVDIYIYIYIYIYILKCNLN